jgi:hypothetical protein
MIANIIGDLCKKFLRCGISQTNTFLNTSSHFARKIVLTAPPHHVKKTFISAFFPALSCAKTTPSPQNTLPLPLSDS